MMRFIPALWLLMLAIPLWAVSAKAQEAKPQQPPLAISGWRHALLPGNTHMNICEIAACTPGSRASYIIYPPSRDYSFERFKEDRRKVAGMLQTRMPGVKYTYEEPTETRDDLFHIMKLQRRETYPDGKGLTVISTLILSSKMTVELISSSPDAKAAAGNLDIYMFAVLTLAAAKPKN